jgi:hypothetical protein
VNAESYSPPLTVHVFWSREGPLALRCAVARALYEFLCRPLDGKIAVKPGVGIPVRLGYHAAEVAELVQEAVASPALDQPCVVAVPLLDRRAKNDVQFRKAIDVLLASAGGVGNPRTVVLPVQLDEGWAISDDLAPCRSAARAPKTEKAARAVDEVSVGICHFLMDRMQPQARRRVKIFVSHAKHDLAATKQLAEKLRDHINKTELKSFFDASDVARGRSVGQQLEDAQREAVLLSVRTDAYADSPYCLDEILTAKRHGVPIVSVHALAQLERRSLTYGGNAFTYVSHAREKELGTITSICLQAWLRHLYFHHVTPAIFRMRNLPLEARYLSRPPELIDFAQSLLPREAATLVIYPDPPLPQAEVAVLRNAHPKVRLATPTTLHRELLRRAAAPPLDGWRIALSLSDSPDLPKLKELARKGEPFEPRGLTDEHPRNVIMHLTSSLIAAGAELGYGGDLRDEGFTMLLSDLIETHKRTTKTSRDLLFNYVAAYLYDPAKAEKISACFEPIDLRSRPGTPAAARQALQLTKMRQRMADECNARVILGGKTFGYSGRLPGQAEEAWAHLVARKPVFVAGGFGGCAGQVARSLQGDLASLPGEAGMRERDEAYRERCDAFDREVRRHDFATPPALEGLWAFFAERGHGFFHGDGAAADRRWSNGLSVAENRRLFASIHPEEIAALVLRGLLWLRDARRQTGETPLKVMLFQGSIADVPDVDSYTVSMLRGAPLRGADGALDTVMDGAIRRHLEQQANKETVAEVASEIVAVKSGRLPGDYVILQTLGDLKDLPQSSARDEQSLLHGWIARGMEELVKHARSLGLDSPALVPFGSNLGLGVRESVCAMLRGLLEAKAGSALHSVALCEFNPARYAEIVALKKEIEALDPNATAGGELQAFAGRVQFTELRAETWLLARAAPPPAVLLDVRRRDESLIVHARAPGSGTALPLEEMNVNWSQVMKLTHAFGNGQPPNFSMQQDIGSKLAGIVLPAQAREALAAHPGMPIDVLHDVEAAAIPFELLCLSAPPASAPHASWPALGGGIRRCLLTQNIPRRRAIHSRGLRLRLLLVADPEDNLRQALDEAAAIQAAFKGRGDVFIGALLGSAQATYEGVLEKIKSQSFDIVHFAGHANFNARDPAQSGLCFPGEKMLTARDIDAAQLDQLPALVVLNACKAGRVRSQAPQAAAGEQSTRDASLAEAIISAGIQGFIGNLWDVEDKAAALFSISLYGDLAGGYTLGEAFLSARRKLFDQQLRDWPNYMLYGQADLRI